MQFLKTLFWVIVAVVAVLFFYTNWQPVTLKLWGGLEADVKLPLILFIGFLIGFLPTFIVHHARLWSLKRRMEPLARNVAIQDAPRPAATAPAPADESDARVATDSKAWPTT